MLLRESEVPGVTMDYGSSHVWMYDDSDEEYFSETELQEGMWLSASDDRWGKQCCCLVNNLF